jgi:seryl-tRNA synthetase
MFPKGESMKIQKTISLDFEVWQSLLLKTDNCSNTINELLKAYLETTPTKNETETLKAEIIKLQAEIAKTTEELKKKENAKTKVVYRLPQAEY